MELHALEPGMPSMRCVGYRQAWGHLAGEYDLARCRDLAIFATRQLAKRQLTWLRGTPEVDWFDPADAVAVAGLRQRVASAFARGC